MSNRIALSILLVEDDPEDAGIFRRYAAESELYDINVTHVATPEQALKHLSQGEYDLVFLDIRLGDVVSGLELLNRIRSAGPDPPTIALTGSGNQRVAVEMLKNGATDYLLKDTFNQEILERAICYTLGQRSMALARERVEEELRESEARYKAMVENQIEAVCRWLPDTTLTYVNQGCCEFFGKPREELLGRRFTSLIPERARGAFAEQVNSLRRNPRVEMTRHQIGAGDGRALWIEWSHCPIFDEQGRLVEFQSVGRDITERKRLEAAKREAVKLRAVNTLSAGIAHNFNNLLTGVLGLSGFVRAQLEEHGLPLEDIDRLSECARRAAGLSQKLRMLTQPVRAHLEAVGLKALVEEFAARCQEKLRADIKLVTEVPDAEATFRASSDDLVRALLAISDNARDAMPGGGTLRIRTRRDVRETDEGRRAFVAVSISDTGRGITPEVLPKIFEPFFSTKGVVGVGLSLGLARHIIEQHGGRIDVRSAPGRGTTVEVLLPIAADAA